MSRAVPLTIVGCLFALATTLDARAAEVKPWDQAQVVALARDLQHSVKELRNMKRHQPPQSIASNQEHSTLRYMNLLRIFEAESRRLGDLAAKGKGRDETYPVFKRIDEVRRDAAEEARRMFLPQATLDKIQQSRASLEQLRLYYEAGADTKPDLHGPTKDEPKQQVEGSSES